MGKERLEYISDLDPLPSTVDLMYLIGRTAGTDVWHSSRSPNTARKTGWMKKKQTTAQSFSTSQWIISLWLQVSNGRSVGADKLLSLLPSSARPGRDSSEHGRCPWPFPPWPAIASEKKKKKHGNGPANNSRTSKSSSHIFPEVHFPASFFGDLVVSGNQRVNMISVLTEACLLVVFLHVPQAVQNNQPPCPQFSQQL